MGFVAREKWSKYLTVGSPPESMWKNGEAEERKEMRWRKMILIFENMFLLHLYLLNNILKKFIVRLRNDISFISRNPTIFYF